MTQMCYASGINPSAIPGADLDPDGVVAAADELAAAATAIRDAGADAVSEWRRLGNHYEAPESNRLLIAMNPVETKARQFGDDLDGVARALRTYAEEIRDIKAGLDTVRSDAWAFRRRIASNSEWEYDQDLIDQNDALVARVNALQVRLWEAERTCANAIRALYGAQAWRAATYEGDPLGYGVDAIPTDAEMPWGSSVPRKDHCPKSAAVGVKRFVWDGVVVDGLWGTVTGLGLLVGIDGTGWHWETMRDSWEGMSALIGNNGDGTWSWGTAGEAWLGLGKGLIAYDTWGDDPARAAGGAVFNIATILIPAGAAVTGTKTAGAAAGNAGRVANLFAKGARIVDFTDPVALTVRGAKVVVPKIGDLAVSLRTVINGLAEVEVPRIPDTPTTIDVPPGAHGLDVPPGADDAPPVRTPQEPSADAPSSGVPDADTPAPVREPEPVMAGGAETPPPAGGALDEALDSAPPDSTPDQPANGTGSDASPDPSTAPGGVGHGADDLVQSPGTAPGTSTPVDAPTTGGHPDAPSGTGGAASETPGGAPRGDGPNGDAGPGAPGSGAADDLPGTADDVPSPSAADAVDSHGSGASPESVRDVNGVTHPVRYAADATTDQVRWTDVLERELADRGMSRAEFDSLISKPIHVLSRESLITLIEIREAMPPIQPDDVVQKIISPDIARNTLGQALFDDLTEAALADHVRALDAAGRSSTYSATRLSGYVARMADTAGLSGPELYRYLGLDYEKTPFIQETSVFGVRYRAGDVDVQVSSMPTEPVTMLRDAMYREATDGSGRSLFDQIVDTPDLAVRKQMVHDLLKEPWDEAVARGEPSEVIRWYADRFKEMEDSLGYEGPHRGNGFAGRGPEAVPEFRYANPVAVPRGAELWQTLPDGTERLIGIFTGRRWDLVVP